MSLDKKSLTELRGIAQAIGCKFTFADDAKILRQKISMKQEETHPPPMPIVISAPDDQRLRTKPPAKVSNEAMITDMLAPLVERGLHLTFTPDGMFQMKYGVKTDSGTLRQPPRIILQAAQRVMT